MAKTEKKAQSKIELLDQSGDVLTGDNEKEENAYGVRVTQLSNGKSIDLLPQSEAAQRMLYVFGAKTLAGHVASQVRQKSGDKADSIPAIAERFDLIESGTWVDRTREAFVPEHDKLAAAATDVLITTGKKAESDRDATYAALLKLVTENEKAVSQVMAIDGVRDRYNELTGKVKTVKTADDLLSMIS